MKLGKPHNINVEMQIGDVRKEIWSIISVETHFHIRTKLKLKIRNPLRRTIGNIRLNIDL